MSLHPAISAEELAEKVRATDEFGLTTEGHLALAELEVRASERDQAVEALRHFEECAGGRPGADMSGSAELRRLLAEVTPGPWELDEYQLVSTGVPEDDDDRWIAECYDETEKNNPALIVYLVNHASALADLIDAAKWAASLGQFESATLAPIVERFSVALSALEGTTDG